MHAVDGPRATAALALMLLDHGADLTAELPAQGLQHNVVSLCLAAGDPEKLLLLLDRGADLHYKRPHAYDALIDTATGRDVERRFDAVALLLEAGADESLLEWTPLIRAVALGSLDDVRAAIGSEADLEHRDHRSRTAWLLAVQTGDIAKADILLNRGAATGARGHCGLPPLHFAIENYHTRMLEWLIGLGAPINETDDFGTTALMAAVKSDNLEAIEVLLNSGADLSPEQYGETALGKAHSREAAIKLLDAGSDTSELSFAGRRAVLGFDPDPDELLFEVTPADFSKARSRRFGRSNPEPMDEPFWIAMIGSGINAFEAKRRFAQPERPSAVWCAQRFGQSLTRLPDGRIIQIAGEHEDYYDSDFCIYNDVFVHEPGQAIRIYGYPESVFPPTDFHSATLLGDHIYIIGSMGYQGARCYGTTPVYRLNVATFHMERLEVSGEPPGWISKHRAVPKGPAEIRVFGGRVVTAGADGTETHVDNSGSFVLNTRKLVWEREDSVL